MTRHHGRLDSEEIAARTTSDDSPTVSCPQCRREIYEDSVQCCYCGHYLEADTKPLGWPTFLVGVILALLGILAVMTALILGVWTPATGTAHFASIRCRNYDCFSSECLSISRALRRFGDPPCEAMTIAGDFASPAVPSRASADDRLVPATPRQAAPQPLCPAMF